MSISKSRFFSAITLASSLILLSACSSTPPTFGEKLQSQGLEVQKIGKQWSEGDNMIEKGNKLIEKGNKEIKKGETLVTKGHDKVTTGESLVKQGTEMKTSAEQTFNQTNMPSP